MATLTPIVSFEGAQEGTQTNLFMDASGNLFGEIQTNVDDGEIFEVEKTGDMYASTPTTIAAFNSDDPAEPAFPVGGLISDSAGDLIGVTTRGGANGEGAVFEIEKSGSTYDSTPITLASLSEEFPVGGLVADASGDLFGTTSAGGVNNAGDVFEIKKTGSAYSSTPIEVASFASFQQYGPGGLITDAQGDLFGTSTTGGGSDNTGYVFEVKKTGDTYESAPTILALFEGVDQSFPDGGLVADTSGDLFGTTDDGVFEIQKTGDTYSAPITLALFPELFIGTASSLLIDAAGDLFGTMSAPDGGSSGEGEVFEVAKTGGAYSNTLTVLGSFDGLNGADPVAGLVADSAGNLFGTTSEGGLHGDGTVFEITDSGFVPPPTGSNAILLQNVSGQAAIWDVSGATLTSSALLGANPGPNWKDVGTGDFNDDMLPDILLQNTNGAVAVWETDGTSVTSSAVVANSGPNWHAIGTGDFNDDGHSDILLQNTSGAVAIWDMNGTSITSSAVVANPGANWKAVGTGDFNDDGHSDILLQNTNGAVAIWEMNGANGTTVADSAVVANPGANWKVVGTGDFNGDGHSDILLQNTNGNVAIWEMNGVSATSSAVVGDPGPNWHAIGTNGGSDILLQNTSGQTAIWDVSGASITGSGAVSANAGPNWRAGGLA